MGQDAKIIPLSVPIQIGSETITQLELSPPKAKHLRGLRLKLFGGDGQFGLDLDISDLLDVAGRMANQAPSVINELSVADMPAVSTAVMDFLPAGLVTSTSA